MCVLQSLIHALFPLLTSLLLSSPHCRYWSYEVHDHLQQKLLDPDRLVAIAEKSLLA